MEASPGSSPRCRNQVLKKTGNNPGTQTPSRHFIVSSVQFPVPPTQGRAPFRSVEMAAPSLIFSIGGRASGNERRRLGDSLVVQWLIFCAPNAREAWARSLVREVDSTCFNKDQRFFMLQLRPGAAKEIHFKK